jgi:hypothetical protein
MCGVWVCGDHKINFHMMGHEELRALCEIGRECSTADTATSTTQIHAGDAAAASSIFQTAAQSTPHVGAPNFDDDDNDDDAVMDDEEDE